MTKNYFTDEQVRELHGQFCKSNAVPLLLLKNITAGDVNHLRTLMNLAVDTAIGEPKAYLVDGRIEQGLFFDKTSAISMANANCGEFKSLHTVQELEN
jgi:hypothetical protein